MKPVEGGIIYKALSPDGNPAFSTVAKVARAMGFEIAFRPIQPTPGE